MKRNAEQQERLYRRVVVICGIIITLSVIVVIVSLLSPEPAAHRPNQTNPVIDTATVPNETIPDEPIAPETTEPELQTQPQYSDDPVAVTIPKKADAEYERWLSAAMVIGLTFEYPDFEILGIYTDSETALEDMLESTGVYLSFRSGGEEIVLHSMPLEAERQSTGTRDLFAADLGFATFDVVTDSHPSFEGMTEITMEELGTLISQSLLVSIYSR